MNWLVGLTWLLIYADGVYSEISDEETHSLISEATHLAQATIVVPNQYYDSGIQQLGSQNIHHDSDILQSSSGTSVASLQNQQQVYQGPQDSRSTSFSHQNTQNNQFYQQPVSQYNLNLGSSSQLSLNNKPSTFSSVAQTQQQYQAPVSSNPSTNQQNSHILYSDNQSDRTKSLANTENSGNIKGTHANSALENVDTKLEGARKVPLVLITIQKNKISKNKSKTNNKNQNSDGRYNSQNSNNRNIPTSSQNTNLGSFSNQVSTSVKGHQSNQETANNVASSSGNVQQQFNSQTFPFVGQLSRGAINNRNFGPLSQYRYPILAGKKVESAGSWKPVDKDGIPVPDNLNLNNFGSVPSTNVQNTQNRFSNTNYNVPRSTSSQTLQQNTLTNFNSNSNNQINQYNTQERYPTSFQSDSNQNKAGKFDNQVTSAYVQQTDVNVVNNHGVSSGSVTNQANARAQNYFVLNNIQEPQYNLQGDVNQRAQNTVSQGQTNVKTRQFSIPLANNENFVSISEIQGQRNIYQAEKGHSTANSQQTANVVRTSNQISYPLRQSISNDVTFPTQVNNNLGFRSNQLSPPNNAQTFVRQTNPSSSTQTTVNNANIGSFAGRNVGKVEQQVYTSSNINLQPQVNNPGNSFISQQSILSNENKNLANINDGSYQQQHRQNTATNFQQTNPALSNNRKTLQNTLNTIVPGPIQNINSQNNVEPSVSSNQNLIQNYGSNQVSTHQNNNDRSFPSFPGSRPSSNINLNSYQNTNRGSSESQDSVVGTNIDQRNKVEQQPFSVNNFNQANRDSYTVQNQISFPDNSQQPDKYTSFQNNQENSSPNKVTKFGRDHDSAPEALLLVLVSAKKSALDNERDEKDDINEGYASAQDEIMEFLKEEANQKMLIESVQEATELSATYKNFEENQNENPEMSLENSNSEDNY